MLLIIYNLILILLSIIFLPLILAAFLLQPKFRAGFWQKLGFYSFKKEGKNTTVFHAVSVGEVNAVKELVKQYSFRHPEENIVVTTTTKTGQEIAKNSFKNLAVFVTYYPYDFFFSVLSFLLTFAPQKILIAETEIWPCFTTLAKLLNIKVYTINGRISPHSFEGYHKIRVFLKPILKKYEKIFMQTKDDAERMIKIGALPEKTEVMGNLKFDIKADLPQETIEIYRDELKISNYRLFIAASTHKGEDEIILNVFNTLKKEQADAKLLLAPRHPQRYQEVSDLLDNCGYKWGRRSEKSDFKNNEIILLDTMGELSKLYSVCYIAFIGGSFSSTGGHNPLEANIWGKPAITGPCVFNFKDIYKTLAEKECAVIVKDAEELKSELISFYLNKEKYNKFSRNSKTIFSENKGAINYVLERI